MSTPEALVKFMSAISKKFLKRGETTHQEKIMIDYKRVKVWLSVVTLKWHSKYNGTYLRCYNYNTEEEAYAAIISKIRHQAEDTLPEGF